MAVKHDKAFPKGYQVHQTSWYLPWGLQDRSSGHFFIHLQTHGVAKRQLHQVLRGWLVAGSDCQKWVPSMVSFFLAASESRKCGL